MKKETSCIISKAVLGYVKMHNNGSVGPLLDNLDSEINLMVNPETYLSDQNNWISCRILAELFKRSRELFCDPFIAFKIGKYAVQKSSLGLSQQILLKTSLSTREALIAFDGVNEQCSRSKKLEIIALKRNEASIILLINRVEKNLEYCHGTGFDPDPPRQVKEYRVNLDIFAPQIAIAIENASLYSKLSDQMEALKKWCCLSLPRVKPTEYRLKRFSPGTLEK